jgi:WD40 repeat protein
MHSSKPPRAPRTSIAAILALAACGLRAEEEKAKAQALPAAVPAEPARVLEGHEADVYRVLFTPDGTKVLTASFDGTARLWDAGTGRHLATLAGHQGKVLAIAVSADSKSILTGSEDKTLKLWDMPGGGAGLFSGHSGPVTAIAPGQDGSWILTASEDGTARLWSRSTRKEALRLEGAGGPLRAAALSPDSRLAAAGGDDRIVRVWDVSAVTAPPPAPSAGGADIVKQGAPWKYLKGTEEPPAAWKGPGFDDAKWAAGPSGFGYSSSEEELSTVGTRLDDMAGGNYLSVYIRTRFAIDDPKRVEKLSLKVLVDDGFVAYLNGHEVARHKMEGSPPAFNATATESGEPAAVEVDLAPHIEKLVAGENVLALQGHNQGPGSSDFVLTPVLAAALKPMEAAKEPEGGKKEPARLEGAGGEVLALAFGPDGGRVAAGAKDGAAYVWSLAGGSDPKPPAKLAGEGAVRAVAFVGGDLLAAAGDGGAVKLWKIGEGKGERSLDGHKGAVLALAVRADGAKLVSGGEDGTVRVWDIGGGKEERALAGHDGPVAAVAFGPEGKEVISGGADGSLRVWSAADGKEARKFTSGAPVRAAAGPAAERYLAAAGNEVVEWRLQSADALRTFSGHGDMVHAAAFAPGGASLASAGGDKTIRFWNAADGKEIRSINAHEGTVYAIAYNHDGTLLASGAIDRTVKIWSTADGKEVKKLEGHGEGVWVVKFSEDGATLWTGGSDRRIRKWSVAEGKELAVLEGHPGWISGLVLFPGGARMASVDHGGNLISWSLAEPRIEGIRKLEKTVAYDLALSPDGNRLATANLNGKAFILEAGAR